MLTLSILIVASHPVVHVLTLLINRRIIMREYAKVPSHFWIDDMGHQMRDLGREAQLTAIYLITNAHSNMIGIYYLPVAFISHETGLPFDEALKALQNLCEIGFCSYDKKTEYVWIHDTAFDQVSLQLVLNDNRIRAVNDTYAALPDLPFLQAFYDKYHQAFFLKARQKKRGGSEALAMTLLSQKQKQEQKQEQKKKQKEKDFMSGKPDVISLKSFSFEQAPKQTALKSQAIQILQFLNEKTGRAYRLVDTNLKLIEARLKSGATLRDCFQVIAKKTREWKNDAKMAEYLRPATLFNATKFEQYVGELVLTMPDKKTV